MDRINAMQAFVAVADLQGFAPAARKLGLSPSGVMINLVEDGVDRAIRIGHLADSTLVARHVGEMRRIVVASSGYLKRYGEPKTPQALASHGTIQFGATAAQPDWHFVGDGREI